MVDTSFFINNGPFTLQQVAEICEAELQNAEKAGVTVNNINTMEKAGAGEICFFYDKKAKAKGAEIKAEACVTTAELAQFVAENVIVLISANPKLAFLPACMPNISRVPTSLLRQGFIRRQLSGRTAALPTMWLSVKTSKSATTAFWKPERLSIAAVR